MKDPITNQLFASHWTNTAQQLWNDPAFIYRRIKEQEAYLENLRNTAQVVDERYKELYLTAKVVRINLMNRYDELVAASPLAALYDALAKIDLKRSP